MAVFLCRVTKEPEIKYTKHQNHMIQFSAVNIDSKNELRIVAYKEVADIVFPQLRKGVLIRIYARYITYFRNWRAWRIFIIKEDDNANIQSEVIEDMP